MSDRDHTNGIAIAAEYERVWKAPQDVRSSHQFICGGWKELDSLIF